MHLVLLPFSYVVNNSFATYLEIITTANYFGHRIRTEMVSYKNVVLHKQFKRQMRCL